MCSVVWRLVEVPLTSFMQCVECVRCCEEEDEDEGGVPPDNGIRFDRGKEGDASSAFAFTFHYRTGPAYVCECNREHRRDTIIYVYHKTFYSNFVRFVAVAVVSTTT